MKGESGANLSLVPGGGLPWEVLHDIPGRLRIRIAELQNDRGRCEQLERNLTRASGVLRVDTSRRLGTLTLRYSPRRLRRRDCDHLLLDALENRQRLAAKGDDSRSATVSEGGLLALTLGLAATPVLPPPLRYLLSAAAISPSVIRGLGEMRRGGNASRVQESAALLLATLAGRHGAAQINNLMHIVARRLEQLAVSDTESELRRHVLPPSLALDVHRGDDALQLPVDALCAGDFLELKSGDIAPLDAMVVRGKAMISRGFSSQQASRVRGDLLAAGSRVLSGGIGVILLQSWEQGSYRRLQSFVEMAITGRESAERYASRLAGRLAPYTVAVSGAVYGFTRDIARSSATLQADFGLPLSLATPVSVESAIAAGTSRGILFRSGEALERLAEVDTLVFDKSGTLTDNEWCLAGTFPAEGVSEAQLRGSLGRAVLACCRPSVLASRPVKPPPVRSLTHREVQDICEQGLHLRVGKRSLSLLSMDDAVDRFGVATPYPGPAESNDGTLSLCLLHDGEYAGAVTFVNEPLHDAAQALEALRQHNIRQTYMITHEAEARVHPGLRQLGFTGWRCELDEIAKLRFIDDLVNRGLRVALVSDGLFQASGDCLNISLSTMPEARQLQADVWLLRPELIGLVAARELASRSTRSQRRSHLANLAANGSILVAGSFNLLSPTLAAVMSNAVTLGMIRGAMKIKEEG